MLVSKDVERNEDGFCGHELLNSLFDEYQEYIDVKQVEEAFDGEIFQLWMEDDVDENHPAYIKYFVKDKCDVSEWQPTRPSPDAVLISVGDTEDGPVAVFVKPWEQQSEHS